MATRKDIRENFYAELEAAASGLVAADSISQEYPESAEELPTIVHNDNYRRVPMNNKTGPSDIDRSGTGVTLYYSLPMEAQFSVLMVAAGELVKEDIYETVRSHFEEFSVPVRSPSEIHGDVHRVEVLDASSRDDEDREPVSRGDSLTISLGYERIVAREEDEVDSIDQNFDVATDAAGDGTVDITHTIN
jgi:hypothetical protein